MDDFVVSVRQIWQYPRNTTPSSGVLLLGQGGNGGGYESIDCGDLFAAVLASQTPAKINGTMSCAGVFLPPTGMLGWGVDPANQSLYGGMMGGALAFTPGAGWRFEYATAARALSVAQITPDGDFVLPIGTVSVARWPMCAGEVATLDYVQNCTVTSFNGRTGPVCLEYGDVASAICLQNGDAIATQCWVNETINAAWQQWYVTSPLVFSFMGRVGDICLIDADVSFACNQPGALARTNTPPPGDVSTRIANCAFVSGAVDDIYQQITDDIGNAVTGNYAPINSPQFTGVPTAPTANPGSNTGQLATTAFVQAAIVASTTGVSSFNTRTGAIILEATDVSEAGGALLNSPAFTGVPTAPTATPGNSSNEIATTAFVSAALAAFVPSSGVLSFNTRTGAVVLSTADITGAGGAPLNNAGLTGIPTAPTAAPLTSTTQLATTAFVTAAISAATGVASWNGRTGAVQLQANDLSAVGGALIASPTFTGNPAAPTQNPGTSNTTLATTAFVTQAIAGVATGVTSFNTRTGAVTLAVTDITGAGGAPLASPNLTGVPTAPTPATTSSDTTVATTAFVKAAISGSALVSSFNSRTGAVTLQAADVSAVGGALLSSPAFVGIPNAPTATAGTNTTQLATTAFVANALSTAGGVSSFNGRAGTVTLTPTDLINSNVASVASGFRNKFRNSGFIVWQRGTSGSVNAAYSADGWLVSWAGSGSVTYSMQSNVNFRGGSERLAFSGTLTSVSMLQRVESYVVWQMFAPSGANQVVTVQWKVYNGTAGPVTPQVTVTSTSQQDNWTSSSSFTNLFVVTGSPIPVGMSTVAYTFLLDPSLRMGVQITLSFLSPPSSGYVDIAEADFRATPYATANTWTTTPPEPEVRSVADEIAFCIRYYQVPANVNCAVSYALTGYANTFPFGIFPMRAVPTVTYQIGSNSNLAVNSAAGGSPQSIWVMGAGAATGPLSFTYLVFCSADL